MAALSEVDYKFDCHCFFIQLKTLTVCEVWLNCNVVLSNKSDWQSGAVKIMKTI